jgi:hypothetical protein
VSGKRNDGVGARLKFHFDFWPTAPITVTPLALKSYLLLPPLGDPAVENHFDCRICVKALSKILIQIRVSTGDNKQSANHCLLIPHLPYSEVSARH